MTILRVDTIAGTGTTFGPLLDGNLEFNSQNYIVLPKGSSNQQGVLRTTEDVIGVGGTYYDNLVLAMPFNEATGLRDVSSRNRNPGTYGNVAISTAQSKYYGSSAYFDGTGDYLELTDALNQFDLGGIDATLEFWTYISSASGLGVIVAKGGNTANWVLTDGFIYQVQYDNVNSKFKFNYNNGGGVAGVSAISGGSQPINSWYHIAVVTTSSNNISLYVNGISVATATNAISKPTTRTRFRVGTDLSNNDFNGYLQDLRIYKGIAKYTANFTPPERIAETGVGFKTGALRYNTDSNKPELYDGNQWTELQISNVGLGTDGDTGPGARGVFGSGGSSPSSIFNVIDYINISSTGNAQDFGDLNTSYTFRSSCSSSTRGLFGGGFITSGNYINSIEYITISSTGDTQDFGDLTNSNYGLCSCSNSIRGIFAGGVIAPVSTINNIEYVTITTTGDSINFGDLTHTITNQLTALSSSTRGLIAGGYSPANTNIINFISISTLGDAQDFGDLTIARHGLEGLSNSVRGIFAGGTNAPGGGILSVIDYITISTTGNAVNFGDLTAARRNSCGTSSPTRGIIAGADYSPASLNTIDYITISTQGNAVDFGDRTGNYGGRCGLSNAHGGL